jgi:hypothetical protein
MLFTGLVSAVDAARFDGPVSWLASARLERQNHHLSHSLGQPKIS